MASAEQIQAEERGKNLAVLDTLHDMVRALRSNRHSAWWSCTLFSFSAQSAPKEQKKLEKAGTVYLKNTPHRRWGTRCRAAFTVDRRFAAGLPSPVLEGA